MIMAAVIIRRIFIIVKLYENSLCIAVLRKRKVTKKSHAAEAK